MSLWSFRGHEQKTTRCTFSSCTLLKWAISEPQQIGHFSGTGDDSWQFGQLLPFNTSGTALLVLTTATVVQVNVYWTAILLLMWISQQWSLMNTTPLTEKLACLSQRHIEKSRCLLLQGLESRPPDKKAVSLITAPPCCSWFYHHKNVSSEIITKH